MMLAEPGVNFTPEMITVAVGLLGLLTIFLLVLNAITAWQRVFGRKPSIELDLKTKAERGTVEKLELDIKGFALSKDLERLQDEARVRSRGLEEQISGLRHEVREEMHSLKAAAQVRSEDFARLEGRYEMTEKLLTEVRQQNTAILQRMPRRGEG